MAICGRDVESLMAGWTMEEQHFMLRGRDALNDSRRRLEAVLDNATVSIFLMDHRQHCIYMNKAAEELTGYTFAEVRELDRPLHDIVHHTYPDGRPFPLEECAIDRAFPEHNKVQGEEIFVHKDGSFYPVGFTASPIRDEASDTIGTIIEVRDIREERLARERQRLLINELNHRVKNTLATVQSLAWQTFRKIDPGVLDRFNGRLAAVSKAYNILTETAWHRASLRQVVGVALELFPRERIEITGPDLDLDPKVAVSLSMALHELGTNAIKHGALSVPSGRVALRWETWNVADGPLLDLTWEETGGPAVSSPGRRGFGSRLIERQLALEFGGSAELDFRTSGLFCHIRLVVPQSPDPLLETPSLCAHT